jgi:hypothetical protein
MSLFYIQKRNLGRIVCLIYWSTSGKPFPGRAAKQFDPRNRNVRLLAPLFSWA